MEKEMLLRPMRHARLPLLTCVFLLCLEHNAILPVNSFTGLPSRLGSGLGRMKKPFRTMLGSVSRDASLSKPSGINTLLDTDPNLFQGTLQNGLSVFILPNALPKGQFEAHLEVLSGSAHELDNQQGMAHLLEHVVYMGNKHRYRLSGTGSRTNAYTDFQHTVFFAACPLYRTSNHDEGVSGKGGTTGLSNRLSTNRDLDVAQPLFPIVMDCFRGIFKPDITSFELEKERAAVLSEMSMINTHDYRAETNVLQQLHKENRISRRFPIGKEEMINAWTVNDVQLYHRLHYRPDNAKLFIVGDIENVQETYSAVSAGLSDVVPYYSTKERMQILCEEYPPKSMATVRRNFPPLIHRWAIRDAIQLPDIYKDIPSVDGKVSLEASKINSSNVDAENSGNFSSEVSSDGFAPFLFKHAVHDRVSLHIFGKHPIEPIVSSAGLKKELMTRIILQALHVRLMIEQRSRQLFDMIEIADGAFTREACALTSIDIHCDLKGWREAVRVVGAEIRRMGAFGITTTEFDRYKRSFRQDTLRSAEQSKSMKHEELLAILMESEARGDVFTEESHRAELCAQLLDDITSQDINSRAAEMFDFLNSSHINHPLGSPRDCLCSLQPSAVVVGLPNRTDFNISAQEIRDHLVASFSDAAIEWWRHSSSCDGGSIAESSSLGDSNVVPSTLFPSAEMEAKMEVLQPRFISANASKTDKAFSMVNHSISSTLGFEQLRLNNGMRVNLCSRSVEPCIASLQVLLPGGQISEAREHPGAHLLGCKTLLESGGFGNFSKEAVEMFCVDHMLAVDVQSIDDVLVIDVGTSHSRDDDKKLLDIDSPVHKASVSSGSTEQISGLEASFQVLHALLSPGLLRWESNDFDIARNSIKGDIMHASKDLDTLCRDAIIAQLSHNDSRFVMPSVGQVEALTLSIVKKAIQSQMVPSDAEVTVCGDAPVEKMKALVLKYLGTLPRTRGGDLLHRGPIDSPWVRDESIGEVNLTDDNLTEKTPSPSSTSNPVTSTNFPSHKLIIASGERGVGTKIRIELPDPEPRAIGFVSGLAPNFWGELPDGRHVVDEMKKYGLGSISESKALTQNKGTLYRALAAVFENILSRRLFAVVREQRHLTYDANFNLHGAQGVPGGYFVVSVTSSKEQIDDALDACVDSMRDAIGNLDITTLTLGANRTDRATAAVSSFHPMRDTLQSSKMSVLDKYRRGIDSNMFWIDTLSGSQHDMFPYKVASAPQEFENAVLALTIQDIQLFASLLFGRKPDSSMSSEFSNSSDALHSSHIELSQSNLSKGFLEDSFDTIDCSRLVTCVGVTTQK